MEFKIGILNCFPEVGFEEVREEPLLGIQRLPQDQRNSSLTNTNLLEEQMINLVSTEEPSLESVVSGDRLDQLLE